MTNPAPKKHTSTAVPIARAQEAFTQQAQGHRENIQDFGELAHTDRLLESFRKVDFQQLQQEDPDQAQQLGFQYQKLRDEREQIVGRIQKREYDTRVTAERDHANRKDQLTATLARDIPSYSPEVHQKMVDVAVSHGIPKAPVGLSSWLRAGRYSGSGLV